MTVLMPILALGLLTTAMCLRAQDDSIRWIPGPEERPELYAHLQDGSAVYLVYDGDTAHAEDVSPSFLFDMRYDSTGVTTYLITEWRCNRSLLRLPTWLFQRAVNARSSLLSYNTTTDSFTCRAGDTLSFYRELCWADPRTSVQDTANYYALDSLDYVVELVRLSDSTRIGLVDSIGILPNQYPGRPRIYGMRPLMARPVYVVPASLDGVGAFMRMLLYHRGPGRHWFTRLDHYTLGASKRLDDTSFAWYIGLFGQGEAFYKPHVLETLTQAAPDLTVVFSPSQPLRATIAFAPEPAGGATAVGVYDPTGRALFYPYMSPGSSETQRVGFTFPQRGVYFVGLLHNKRLVATRKVVTGH